MYYLQEMSRMADPATSTESRSGTLKDELRKLGVRTDDSSIRYGGPRSGGGYGCCGEPLRSVFAAVAAHNVPVDGCIVNRTDVVKHDPNHDGCFMIETHPHYSSNDDHADYDGDKILRTVLSACPQLPQDNIPPKDLKSVVFIRMMERLIAVAEEKKKDIRLI